MLPKTIPDAASPELVSNENNAAAAHVWCYAHDADGDDGLDRGYSGGRWGGFDVVDVVHTFGASVTTYVSAKVSDGTIDFSTSSTNFNDTPNYKRIEVVISGASAIDPDDVADHRGGPGGAHGGGASTLSRAPSVQSVTSAATVTPTWNDDLVKVTAQAVALAIANPTGTPAEGLGFVLRIKDNGTARAITYDTEYRAIGVTLPTTTVISKTLYMACLWNATDSKVDVLAIGQEA